MNAPPSERTRVKRYHWLAQYDRATVHAILDAMPMCSVGYSFDNVLVFAAGGLALADFDFTQTGRGTDGTVYTGWTIGGGFDVAFARNWIVRLEYLHDDFGSKNYLINNVEPYRVKLTGDTVRGALMYKF